MGKLHEGMATHGMAWCANEQTAGKGQRGKSWNSQSGKNILMSIVIQPAQALRIRPFFLSSFIAVCCHQFLEQKTSREFLIKWPNDIYFSDRKAGGILIENVFAGTAWKWAVVGIGINVNQTDFPGESRAISLKQIKPQDWDPKELASQLHRYILDAYAPLREEDFSKLLKTYNQFLFKKNEQVRLKKNFAVFNTTIKEVNENGQLVTEDVMERSFNFGGVEWLL